MLMRPGQQRTYADTGVEVIKKLGNIMNKRGPDKTSIRPSPQRFTRPIQSRA